MLSASPPEHPLPPEVAHELALVLPKGSSAAAILAGVYLTLTHYHSVLAAAA